MINPARYKIVILILSVLIAVEAVVLILLVLRRPKKASEVTPAPPAMAVKGKIAIVLDDWGYNLNNLEALRQIKYPLTCAVLPNLAFSQAVARELQARGREAILHLPMQPQEKFPLEQDTIMSAMGEARIIDILRKDLTNVTYARGVSNHMGSRVTEDPRIMEIVFKELKQRKLYFLDSLVSSKSVCQGLAKRLQIGYARRDVFLDNSGKPGYIKGQIYKLKARARLYGQAIGIGHDRSATVKVLKEIMPQLEREGYKFVFVSELVK